MSRLGAAARRAEVGGAAAEPRGETVAPTTLGQKGGQLGGRGPALLLLLLPLRWWLSGALSTACWRVLPLSAHGASRTRMAPAKGSKPGSSGPSRFSLYNPAQSQTAAAAAAERHAAAHHFLTRAQIDHTSGVPIQQQLCDMLAANGARVMDRERANARAHSESATR
jgi:hypothetical protein